MTSTLYGDLLRAGVQIASHESDLYFKDCPEGRAILLRYPAQAAIARHFWSSPNSNEKWWDVPFAYLPWWKAQAEADAMRAGQFAMPAPDVIEPGDLKD